MISKAFTAAATQRRLGLGVLLLGVGLLALSLSGGVRGWSRWQSWPKVEATVVELGIRSRPVFAYTDRDGARHRAQSAVRDPLAHYRLHEVVTLATNPESPGQFVSLSGLRQSLLIGSAAGLVFVAVGAALWVGSRSV